MALLQHFIQRYSLDMRTRKRESLARKMLLLTLQWQEKHELQRFSGSMLNRVTNALILVEAASVDTCARATLQGPVNLRMGGLQVALGPSSVRS